MDLVQGGAGVAGVATITALGWAASEWSTRWSVGAGTYFRSTPSRWEEAPVERLAPDRRLLPTRLAPTGASAGGAPRLSTSACRRPRCPLGRGAWPCRERVGEVQFKSPSAETTSSSATLRRLGLTAWGLCVIRESLGRDKVVTAISGLFVPF